MYKNQRTNTLRIASAVVAGLLLSAPAQAVNPILKLLMSQDKIEAKLTPQTTPEQDKKALEELAYATGIQAYLYGVPLVRFDQFRSNLSSFVEISHKPKVKSLIGQRFSDDTKGGIPYNKLSRMITLSDDKVKIGVSPNNDTIYAVVYLQLKGNDAYVFSNPNTEDTFWVAQVSDAYLSTAGSLGKRATGNLARHTLFVGPDFNGEVPEGMDVFRLPTADGLTTLRVEPKDKSDLSKEIALMKKFSYVSLQEFKGGEPLPVKPVTRASKDGELGYFKRMVELTHRNPPTTNAHAVIWNAFNEVGISLDKPFDENSLSPEVRRGLKRALEVAPAIVARQVKHRGYDSHNYWGVDLQGITNDDILHRAEVATSGLIVNDPRDAIYFLTYRDANNELLDGNKSYTVHFEAGKLPPVKAFWSLTTYDIGYSLVKNELNRFSIGDRTKGLKYNVDGSLTLYLQSTPPKVGTSNWLPITPEGRVRMNLRMYWPEEIMFDSQRLEQYLPDIRPNQIN